MVIIDSVWNEIKVDNITNKNMDFFLMTQDPIFYGETNTTVINTIYILE